mmetsp:Transcript_59215/g.106421  ORF Transcript_59215/g.106421 Transcript_59215/m.106421 type:complete len:158 (-) Transcript_59215:26-499(-)
MWLRDRTRASLQLLLCVLARSQNCTDRTLAVASELNDPPGCAALLQREAHKLEPEKKRPVNAPRDVEWRARQMVIQNAQEEATVRSLQKLLAWFSNAKITSALQLPLIRQWHAVSAQLLDRGLTAHDCRVIFVCAFAGLMLMCILAGRRLSGHSSSS